MSHRTANVSKHILKQEQRIQDDICPFTARRRTLISSISSTSPTAPFSVASEISTAEYNSTAEKRRTVGNRLGHKSQLEQQVLPLESQTSRNATNFRAKLRKWFPSWSRSPSF